VKPILFLPGAAGRPEFWRPVAERLQDLGPTHRFAYPGFGDVPADPAVRSLDDLFSWLPLRLPDGRSHVVAQSTGGILAVRLAIEHPDRVARLVLVATSGGVDVARLGGADWRAEYQASLPDAPPWFIEDRTDLGSRLDSIRAPTLLLWSDTDPVSPLAVADLLASAIPGAGRVVVHSGTHAFAEERPDEVAAAIRAHRPWREDGRVRQVGPERLFALRRALRGDHGWSRMTSVRGFVGTTDHDWFTFLSARQPLDEVNFWQPSAHGFKAPPGTPFFFKLKSPHNAIGGFGIFARYEAATVRLAWEAFGEKNGAATFDAMAKRVGRYARETGGPAHRIGCIMVATPVFFPEGAWVDQPDNWRPNIVSGRGYDLTEGEGRRIWEECLARGAGMVPLPLVASAHEPAAVRFGEPQLVRPRLGQGTFRVAVTGAYGGACAVSREHSLPVLEAAHIRPYGSEGSHEVVNGLLLRADIHRLFDTGYVTVTPDRRFVVSRRLAQEWENGKAYYDMHGREIYLPKHMADRPDAELLRWHNENVFERTAA
jgi:putative restriction endonuclease